MRAPPAILRRKSIRRALPVLPSLPQRRRRRAPRGGRARATLLYGIALFLLVQIGASIALDHFGRPVRFAELDALLGRFARANHPDIVFLGSSRFLGGIAADGIARELHRDPDQVFNAAVTGGDAITQEYVLAELLGRGARPRVVVIEVGPDTLNHRTYWYRYHVARQWTWLDVPTYLTDMIALHDAGSVALTRLLPLYYFRSLLLAGSPGVLPAPRTAADFASANEMSRPESFALSERGISAVENMLRDYRTGGRTGAALDRLLERCKTVGAQVILVGVPVTSAYRSAIPPQVDAAYQAFVAGLVRKHGCRFVDFRDRVPDALFEDVHHLSAAGACHFTRLLAKEVLD